MGGRCGGRGTSDTSTGVVSVRFAVEGCRHLTRRLEADLLRAGQQVVRVHTRLMAGARRGTRRPGKSDPIDAEAVAIAALREPDLPVAQLDGPAREVKLLVDARADLVVQRTRAASRLRWFLHELDPQLDVRRAGCAATQSSPSWPTGSPTSTDWWPGWPATCWSGSRS